MRMFSNFSPVNRELIVVYRTVWAHDPTGEGVVGSPGAHF